MTDSIPVLKYVKKVNLFTHFGSISNRLEVLRKAFRTYFTVSEKKQSALWDGLNQFHKNHTLHSHFTINPGWLHENHIQYKSIHIRDYFGNTYS